MPITHTPRLQNRKIVIVDDDEDILASIDLAMRNEGALTTKLIDGNAAIYTCQHSNPDAVILDMMLPKASGFIVLEKIKRLDDPPVVVMITANQGKRHTVYAENMGVDAYLNKPVSLQKLIVLLVDLLKQRDSEYVDDDDADDGDENGDGDEE